MMEEVRVQIGNVLGASWTGAVLLDYLDGAVAIIGGLAIIWMNVEKGLQYRKRRQNEKK